MPLLRDDDRKALEERFQTSLRSDVKIRLFTQSDIRSMLTIPGQPQQTNEYAKVTKELLQELMTLSPKLSLQVLDVHGDGAAEAKRLGIEQVPAIVLGDDPEGRVRFYGAPVGNEFATMLSTIESLSQEAPQLAEHVAKAAKERFDQPVHLRVFVTPT